MKKLTLATAALLLTMTSGVHAQLSGRDVLTRALKATGADTVLPRHKNMTMTATFSLPAQGVEAPLLNVRGSDNTFHTTLTVDGFGTIEQGYAEGTAYSIHPQSGTAILTGAQEASSKRQAMWRDDPDGYASITNEGQEKYNGRDAYKVKLVTKDSVTVTRYYDTETYLPMATISTTATPDGPVEVVTVVSDYKNFGGMMMPTKQVQQIGGNEQMITVNKVEFDVAPADALALPAAIKALKK